MAAHQARPYLGFPRQEHWSGLPLPSPDFFTTKWVFSNTHFKSFWLIIFLSYFINRFIIFKKCLLEATSDFVVVQSHSCIWLFRIPWTAAQQASLSLTISWSLPKLHRWYHPAISSSDALFSFCPQSSPASGTYLMSRLFSSGDQNTGASTSASVLPMSVQGWFPLRLAGLISLLSKGLRSLLQYHSSKASIL